MSNALNEISTNESPTQSPSNNKKEIEIKNLSQNNFFFNKEPINIEFNPKEDKNLLNLKKEKKVYLNSKSKIKRRIFKRIIKQKNKFSLLDFDFILRDIIGHKNIKYNLFEREKSSNKELLNKNNIKINLNLAQKNRLKSKDIFKLTNLNF